MKVTLLGFTEATAATFKAVGCDDLFGEAPTDVIAEFAGRSCYQAWEKKNPATATNKGYLDNIIDHAHFSVLEHNAYTFYIEGVSRALTHELIRHRHLSYSQLSQRFVDEADRAEPVLPPAFGKSSHRKRLEALAAYVDHITQEAYKEATHILQKADGLSRKEARQAARAFLPNMTETKIVVTGNIRAYREFLAKRLDPHADEEIRECATMLYNHLRALAPNAMQELGTR